ncbi:hypothetical protein [Pseudomonas sp. RIT288]|uniref:hypothetical protein n=1 Tax=Pseudomonas sp. RIT288 TaxID=1470589 RepID=UPI001267E613|nr:hypothetical protein [Pseudomonas sp. RIT288]
MGMLSLLENTQPTGTIACPGACSEIKFRASHRLAITDQGLASNTFAFWRFKLRQTEKSAQEVAQYCATSCALG